MIIILMVVFVNIIASKEIIDNNRNGPSDDITSLNRGYPIKRHSLAHQDVKLDCQRSNAPDTPDDLTFAWIFYPSKFIKEGGKEAVSYPLCGGSDQPVCEKRLVLQNVNSSFSGLYKCSIVKSEGIGFTLTSIPIITYHLEVRDHDPKFIEGPRHIMVYEHSEAILECKVNSEFPMAMKWFKRDDMPPSNVTVIRYNNHTYRPVINVENHKEGNVYISELFFKRIGKNDSGIYACTFLSPTGQILYQEGSIAVQQTKKVFSTLVQEKWEIFAAVLVVIILVLVTVACMILLCFKKMLEKADDQPLNLGRKTRRSDTDGNDTSEYEHVVL